MRQLKFTSNKRILFIFIAFVMAFGLVGLIQTALVAQAAPSAQATTEPTAVITTTVTVEPTTTPTATTTVEPTVVVTSTPTVTATVEPTTTPTATTTVEPTTTPTVTATVEPTTEITTTPTVTPTVEPTTTPTATVDPTLDFTVEVTGPNQVALGDTFEINVVAENIPEPGIFGYQFKLNWDGAVFAPVTGTLVVNSDFAVVARSGVSSDTLEIAVSRQGDVTDLTGPLTLLTMQLQANTVTDPDAASLTLADWKFGRKGGIDIPVDQVINLDVVVTEDTNAGDITGQVTVEGREATNQAGHLITATGDLGAVLTDTTDANGAFRLDEAPADTYGLTADSAGFLAATCDGVVHTGDALTELLAVELLAGDLDDSGLIDITDAVVIGVVFGTTSGEVADLNVDGVVDILDLILMAANFGQSSDDHPWVCQ